MATVDQLEQLDREVEEAERRALRDLAAHLRAAVLDMPTESALARAFVRGARKFEMWAGGPSPASSGAMELASLARDAQAESLVVDSGRRVVVDAIEFMEARLPGLDADDPFRETIERLVDFRHGMI
jgi:hypothetical protein